MGQSPFQFRIVHQYLFTITEQPLIQTEIQFFLHLLREIFNIFVKIHDERTNASICHDLHFRRENLEHISRFEFGLRNGQVVVKLIIVIVHVKHSHSCRRNASLLLNHSFDLSHCLSWQYINELFPLAG